MTRSRIINLIGIALLAACFGVSTYRILGRTVEELDPKTTVLRFAHFELEDGIREVLSDLSREYERLHPAVRVIQIAIPERFYPQWIKTQLIGETAPDIIELQAPYIRDEIKGRFISPLTGELEAPNPYNAGTELEGTPWRSTFIDGVSANHVISQHMMEKYGVPMTIMTTRMYYNVSLLRKITGSEDPPRTYSEFIEFGRLVRAHAKKTNEVVYPIAGSKPTARPFLDGMMASMTQSLGLKLDSIRRLTNPDQRAIGIKYLQGEWNVYEESIQLALGMVREIASLMQPGFFLKDRDDAIFFFVQQRAVMIAASSRDSHTKFVEQSGWLPAVVGVPPKRGTEAFVPFLKGTDPPTGFSFLGLGNLDNMRRLYDDYFYLLVGETGSVIAFSDAFDAEVRSAILLDLGWSYQDRKVDTLVQDALIVAFRRLQSLGDQSRDYRSMETHTLYQQARREAGLNRWASAIAEFGDRVD